MDAQNINPITSAISVIEYVIPKEQDIPSVLSIEKIKKFQKMRKEDFYKDDTYRCMWDKNWITKSDDEGKCK